MSETHKKKSGCFISFCLFAGFTMAAWWLVRTGIAS